MLIGLVGTPAWPWFASFLNDQPTKLNLEGFAENGVLPVMLSSTIILFLGLGLGWWFYTRRHLKSDRNRDPLEQLQPQIFNLLRNGYFVDRFYEVTVVRFNKWCALASAWLERWVWGGAVRLVTYLVLGLSHTDRSIDAMVVNRGFDQGCLGVTRGGQILSRLQNGLTQNYLRIIGIAFAAFVLFLIWGRRG
jgi:NADH-quinone oxidoreductase subunit L